MKRIVFTVFFFLVFTGSALAAPIQGPIVPPVPTTATTPTTPTTPTPPTGGLLSSPDTTIALGGNDVSCSHLAGASPEVVENCKNSGLAESSFPPSNYGTDTHVDTGFTDPGNDAAALLQEIIGGSYALIAHVLTWILLGLGLAFGFDLFAQDTTGQIQKGLSSGFQLFTLPLLSLFIIIGGIVGCIYWFGQRSEGKAVVHWGGMLAMMAFAIIVIQNPQGVFGWVDQAANGISSEALSAFSGDGGGGGAGFANAEPGLYKVTMEEPWCAMEFGSVTWCMAPIDPAMATAKSTVLAHLDQALGDQGSSQLAQEQAPIERARLAAAKTNGELFLAFPPNSNARNGKNDDWTFYHALLQEHPELAAIRGSGGVWEHFAILFLSSIVGFLFLGLLLYITWQLLAASVFFVVCLCLGLLAIFAPAFGDPGRKAFGKWLGWSIESLLKRVIFAVYLGILIFVSNLTLKVPWLEAHWLFQWGILAVVWAMGIAYRHKILTVMTGGAYMSHGHPGMKLKGLALAGAGAYAWKRAPQKVTQVHEHHHEGNEASHLHQHLHVGGDDFEAARERVYYDQPSTQKDPDMINGTARELKP